MESGLPRGVEEVQSILHSPSVWPSTSPSIASSTLDPVHDALCDDTTLSQLTHTMATTTTLSRSKSTSSTSRSRYHLRVDSVAGPSTRKANRLSITLPIQSGTLFTPSSHSSPSPTNYSTASVVIREDPDLPTDPTDSNFLTALAAHERRVLDIKEELARAEDALQKLKLEWASHEAQKKRHEARRVQRMRTLPNATPSAGLAKDEERQELSAAAALDHERKRALFNNPRLPQRTVFNGSRHVRALSLLSPERSQTMCLRELHSEPTTAHPDSTASSRVRTPPFPPASTHQDPTMEGSKKADERVELGGLPSELLMRTGRQMASDLKDGLLTFIEDLKQVTVGDEAVYPAYPRSQPPSSKRPRGAGSSNAGQHSLWPAYRGRPSAAPHGVSETVAKEDLQGPLIETASFWADQGPEKQTPVHTPACHRHTKKTSAASNRHPEVADQNESWDTWDSPVPADKASQFVELVPAVEDPLSSTDVQQEPLTSCLDVTTTKQDSIPWPALTKLSPGSLRRTASNFLDEWERSLTPIAGEGSSHANNVHPAKNAGWASWSSRTVAHHQHAHPAKVGGKDD